MTDVANSGAAVARAADAMLRALGGEEITIVFPLVALPNDPSAQLGLVDPGAQQVTFSPVAVLTPNLPASGVRKRLQFLISATAVSSAMISQNAASAEALFDSALGINYDGDVFHIENVATEYFAGTAYLYKVTAVV